MVKLHCAALRLCRSEASVRRSVCAKQSLQKPLPILRPSQHSGCASHDCSQGSGQWHAELLLRSRAIYLLDVLRGERKINSRCGVQGMLLTSCADDWHDVGALCK
jgi:hypothetical protein